MSAATTGAGVAAHPPGLTGLSLMDPGYRHDPAPHLAQMRRDSPVLHALKVLTSRVASFELPADEPRHYGENYIAHGLLSLPLDATYR